MNELLGIIISDQDIEYKCLWSPCVTVDMGHSQGQLSSSAWCQCGQCGCSASGQQFHDNICCSVGNFRFIIIFPRTGLMST